MISHSRRSGRALASVLVLVASAGLLASGCSGAGTSPSTSSTFSATTAQSVAQIFASASVGSVDAGSSSADGAPAATLLSLPSANTPANSMSRQYNRTTPCPGGGTVTGTGQLDGTITNDHGVLTDVLDVQGVDSASGCVVDGWTVTGSSKVSGNATLSIGKSSMTLDRSGSFTAVPKSGSTVSCQSTLQISWDQSSGGTYAGTTTCPGVPGSPFQVGPTRF